MILGPAGRSVLHRDSPDALSLSLAYVAATNVSGDSLVRAKIGIRPRARPAIIAPSAHKVIESGGHDHGVWLVMFQCKLTERLGEAEQCYAE